jgi:hypothetical protein
MAEHDPTRPTPDPHTHLIDFPEALEAFFARLPELRQLVGPAHAAGVDRVGERLRSALAARAQGDLGSATTTIVQAMRELSELVSEALPSEGPMMRAMATQFAQAVAHGALGDARQAADVMRVQSGSTVHPKKPA